MALIFVIDPRPSVVSTCRSVLIGRGHRVQAFSELSAALDPAQGAHPEVVIAHPNGNPDLLVQHLRRDFPRALVLILVDDREDERGLLAALDAANDVLLTPLVPAELAARVAAALRSRSRAEQQARVTRLAANNAQRPRPPRKPQVQHSTATVPPPSAPHASLLESSSKRAAEVTDVLSSGELSAKGVLKHALVRDDARLAGRIFDAYRLVRTLGVGGMGVVLEAIHRETGQRMALKILRHDLEGEPEAPLRFLREAYVLQGIQSPHVVRLEDIGRAGGTIFYAMEFVDGRALGDLLDERRRLPIPLACTIACGCAKALAAMARSGVVHRDIKPANIFVSHDERLVKLGDFGLAKRARARDVTPRKSLIGTPHYLAPEVISGEPASSKADIYSLGVVLHEMLCGSPLHAQEQTAQLLYEIVYGEPPDIAQSLRGLPEEVRQVVERATCRYPEDRYPDAASFARDLERLRLRFTRRQHPQGSPRHG